MYNTKFYFRDDAGSEANEIKFETIEQSALCVVSDTPHMKEERWDLFHIDVVGQQMRIFYRGAFVGLLHKFKYSFNARYGTYEGKT